MGDSPKWVKSRRRRKRERERKKERAKVGDNNGQATHGARKHAWRTQAAWAKKVKTIASFASTEAAWTNIRKKRERAKVSDNNGHYIINA